MVSEQRRKVLSQVLSCLRQDARISLVEIARRIGIPTSTAFSSYDRLRKEVIVRHTSLVDFERLGYPLRKCLLLTGHDRARIVATLARSDAVNSLSRCKEVMLCDAIFSAAREVEELRQALRAQRIKSIGEYDILEELKQEECRI